MDPQTPSLSRHPPERSPSSVSFVTFLPALGQLFSNPVSADLGGRLPPASDLCSPASCLVNMTQPDLLLLSILNLAKNYISGLKKKKSHSLFRRGVALDFFDVQDM